MAQGRDSQTNQTKIGTTYTWASHAVETGINPEDKDSGTIFLVLSSWEALKDIKWGSAETLFEKSQCEPAALVHPNKGNKVKHKTQLKLKSQNYKTSVHPQKKI